MAARAASKNRTISAVRRRRAAREFPRELPIATPRVRLHCLASGIWRIVRGSTLWSAFAAHNHAASRKRRMKFQRFADAAPRECLRALLDVVTVRPTARCRASSRIVRARTGTAGARSAAAARNPNRWRRRESNKCPRRVRPQALSSADSRGTRCRRVATETRRRGRPRSSAAGTEKVDAAAERGGNRNVARADAAQQCRAK